MTREELIKFSERIKALWENKQIKVPVHLCGGNEQELIDIFRDIHITDWVFSTHRNHYHYLLKGGDTERIIKELTNPDKWNGASGSMCTVDRKINFLSSAIVGGVCAIAAGAAWAIKAKSEQRRVWVFVGDGCVDTGHMYEAVRYAEGYDLPITFVIEDNDRSTCTSVRDRWGKKFTKQEVGLYVSPKVKWYTYKPTYPHVGSGTYVQF